MNGHCAIVLIVLDSIIAEIIKNLLKNRAHSAADQSFSVNVKMHVLFLRDFFQVSTYIPGNGIDIHIFPLIRIFSFVKLRNLNGILHKLDQPLSLPVNPACKLFHILFLHKAVLNNLGKT